MLIDLLALGKALVVVAPLSPDQSLSNQPKPKKFVNNQLHVPYCIGNLGEFSEPHIDPIASGETQKSKTTLLMLLLSKPLVMIGVRLFIKSKCPS